MTTPLFQHTYFSKSRRSFRPSCCVEKLVSKEVCVSVCLLRGRLFASHIDGVNPPPVVRIGIGNDDALGVEDFHFLCVQGLAGGDRDNLMLEQVNDTLIGSPP